MNLDVKPFYKHLLWQLVEPFFKILVLLVAISGRYPAWMVTPDDPVSPFGKGEPTVVKVYQKFGRYIGDIYWLAWRNCGYGISYSKKPDWLKDPNIKYEELTLSCIGNSIYLLQPNGTQLWETTRKFGPFYFITGYRLRPIMEGALENLARLKQGLERYPRPAFHPNMDARPIISLRTKRTL